MGQAGAIVYKLSKPTLSQVKLTTLVLAIFFLLMAGAQYYFVRWQTKKTNIEELKQQASAINEALDYNEQPNFSKYNKSYIEANSFQAINLDGTVIDTEGGRSACAPDFLPSVRMPWPYSNIQQPIRYQSPLGENWLILTVKIEGGFGVVGISEIEFSNDQPAQLKENSKHLPKSVDGLGAKCGLDSFASEFDNSVHHAVVDDSGRLLRATGRLPFRVDAMTLGRESTAPGEKSAAYGASYFVLYSPIKNKNNGNQVGTIIGYYDISREAATLNNMLIFSSAVGGLSFAIFLVLLTYSSIRNEAAKQNIRASFEHYFSPQVLDLILRDPKQLEGQRREVSVMFTDIRSFTKISETLPPQKLTKLLRDYFDEMTEEVTATEGVVDKFIGDAIMVFWSAPVEQQDHADRAIRTAFGMLRRLDKLKVKWASEGLPAFDIGIAIHSGLATVGNIGSKKRSDYTIIGDVVNVAARLEELNKKFNSQIIISAATRNLLADPVKTEPLGTMSIRGREEQITAYAVILA